MLKFLDRRMLYRIALALFALSLAMPAFSSGHVCTKTTWVWGWLAFLLGPMGILAAQVGWLANPLMLLAALLRKQKSLAVIIAGLAVIDIAATGFSLTSLPSDAGSDLVCHFGPGYYFWLASSIALLRAISLEPK